MTSDHADSGDIAAALLCCDELFALPRYAHYGRIPARMCHCLARFGVRYDDAAVVATLRLYYLFIGLCDDVLDDTNGPLDGEWLLDMLLVGGTGQEMSPQRECYASPLQSVAGQIRLRCKAGDEPQIRSDFRALLDAVRGERHSGSMRDYVAARKLVGQLTAKISYLLIAPYLQGAGPAMCDFFCQVGAVGCLIDSAVDLRADWRAGSLGFRPGLLDRFRLYGSAAYLAAGLAWRHPRMLNVFVAGIGDTVLDRTSDRRSARGAVPITAT